MVDLSKGLLLLYRYLTAYRVLANPEVRLSAEDILKKDSPAMLMVGPADTD